MLLGLIYGEIDIILRLFGPYYRPIFQYFVLLVYFSFPSNFVIFSYSLHSVFHFFYQSFSYWYCFIIFITQKSSQRLARYRHPQNAYRIPLGTVWRAWKVQRTTGNRCASSSLFDGCPTNPLTLLAMVMLAALVWEGVMKVCLLTVGLA